MSVRQGVPSEVRLLLAARPAAVQELALSARQVLLATLPGAVELPDSKANLIGYGFGTRYKDIVATIMLSQAGIKIGLAEGALLPDPASLLAGAGKVHRHIAVRTKDQLQRPEVLRLLEAGLRAWHRRAEATCESNAAKERRVT